MTNAKLIILIFLIAPNVVVIQKEARMMIVMFTVAIVTVFHMLLDKNVTNVTMDIMVFLIAKVSIIITFELKIFQL